MCTDPNHMNEFKEISGSIIRMETKLDNVLSAVSDHEARLRVTEAAIIVHNDNRAESMSFYSDVSTLKTATASNTETIKSWKKALWIIATAAFSGLGLSIWDVIRRGMN